jgi:hypothetical protein
MSVAADTREAVRDRPFLRAALRAGVVNYAAAADFLDVDADREAVAAALRRYAADLPDYGTDDRDVTVRMRRGVRLVGDGSDDAGVADDAAAEADDAGGEDDPPTDAEPVVRANDQVVVSDGDQVVVSDGGQLTAVVAKGEVDAAALHGVLGQLDAADVYVDAAGVAGGELVVVVTSRDGAAALRVVEEALDAVPT